MPFLEQNRLAVPARDADIGLLRLPWPVDHAAHHRHRDRFMDGAQALLHLGGDADQIDFGPATGGARNQHGLPCSQPERAEQVEPSLHLPDRISRQGDPDGIPDTVEEQGTDPGGGFEQPHPLGARLGHAEMERIGAGRRRQAVSGRHGRHMGRFE